MSFRRISVNEAQEMINDDGSRIQIVDIRDDESYEAGHIEGAVHLHNSNLHDFLQSADPEIPVLVCCYHGHMSQGAAAFFIEQGFEQALSLDGGYEAWSEVESSD